MYKPTGKCGKTSELSDIMSRAMGAKILTMISTARTPRARGGAARTPLPGADGRGSRRAARARHS